MPVTPAQTLPSRSITVFSLLTTDSEDYDLAGTPDIPASVRVTPSAPTPVSTPVPPDTTVAQEPTPIRGTLIPASTPIPGPPKAPTPQQPTPAPGLHLIPASTPSLALPKLPPLSNQHPPQAFLPLLWPLTPLVLTSFGSPVRSLWTVRRQQMYNGFLYNIPHEEETGQLYLITRGRHIGIFVSWAHMSPYVTGVSFATCLKVNSLDEEIACMMEAIDLKEARWLT
ncbi:hypothetical protein EV363DRAFT_1462373 [Boletus edulis]|nr:hypothetical protein EV363DRAFT_1462373 [Boletus edulis]